ncbi:MAG: DUF6089 family protein [Chitinophagales bacterium]|nr:DUF6089 family protein [Chitinophagales bacterium]
MKKWLYCIAIGISIIAFPSKNHAQYSDLGLGLGFTTYWGDLNVPSFSSNLIHNSGLAIEAHGRIMKGERLGLKAAFLYGTVRGDDSRSDVNWQLQRNLNFSSYLAELSIMGELYILPFSTDPGRFFFAPYLTAGISAFWFSPETVYHGREVKLQPLGTEGQGMQGRPEKYRLNNIAIPFGVGAKFILTETINLGVEVVFRRSFTDYIDDVSTTYVNYDDLSRANGVLSARLSNRMNEYLGQDEPVVLPTGAQRGGANVPDYYIGTLVTLNFVLTDSRGRKRIGGNKVSCPTFK